MQVDSFDTNSCWFSVNMALSNQSSWMESTDVPHQQRRIVVCGD